MLTRARDWALLVVSLIAVYWLQPATPIRHLDFWLPTISIALTVIVWRATQPRLDQRATFIEATAVIGVIIAVSILRYVEPLNAVITRTRPPELWQVLVFIFLSTALVLALTRLHSSRAGWLSALLIGFVVLLFILKFEPTATWLSASVRALNQQDVTQATAQEWRWLGISYLLFRLIHTLRERASGKLPAISLREFATFALFAPALQAGPIDKADRFVKDLRASFAFNLDDIAEGARRIVIGAFKKFALADTLALVALNDLNATQSQNLWTWSLLYAYAFRIYFDFSGYTDIALGIARIFGIKLPENFKNPYLKSNLTLFWNNWHITLAQWFRAYWFNPLTRMLRTRDVSPIWIVLIGQSTTMLLIGLWHGVTTNFVLWGVWHAIGLFIHNRWAEFSKSRMSSVYSHPLWGKIITVTGVALTFHFVTLGWVWFALSKTNDSLFVFGKLFGVK
jgi:D-alanyl-lipoteichoic acid acyltransferase DltB (MBOAT superfamily)